MAKSAWERLTGRTSFAILDDIENVNLELSRMNAHQIHNTESGNRLIRLLDTLYRELETADHD